jgi:hypothetical protein
MLPLDGKIAGTIKKTDISYGDIGFLSETKRSEHEVQKR